MQILRVLASVAALATSVGQVSAQCANAGANRWPMFVSGGWRYTKVAGRVTTPRDIVIDTNGNLLVVAVGVGVNVYNVDQNSGCTTTSKTIVSNRQLNHGLFLSPNGTTVFASTPDAVFAWDYNAQSQTTTNQRTIVSGMNSAIHNTRTILIPKTKPNLLVVSRGSEGNLDQPTINPATGRAMIKVFDLTRVPSAGYNYARDGYQAGYGLRNHVGICTDPNDMVWGVENSADDLRRIVSGQTVDVHADNPAEELNYIGDVSTPNNQWYGYPTCFAVGAPSAFRDKTFQIGDNFVQAPNTSFTDTTCDTRAVKPRLLFPAHTAPLDCKFDAAGTTMYVTFHGSWNRPTPPGPIGFKVVAVPFTRAADGSYNPTSSANVLNGFQDIMGQNGMSGCGFTSCLRPVGLAVNSKNQVYMTSDSGSEGEIFLLSRS